MLLPRVSLHPSMDAPKRGEIGLSLRQTTERTDHLPTDLQSLNRPQKCPHHFTFYPCGLSGLAADFTLLCVMHTLFSFWHRASRNFFRVSSPLHMSFPTLLWLRALVISSNFPVYAFARLLKQRA